jgi:hypothetical protein
VPGPYGAANGRTPGILADLRAVPQLTHPPCFAIPHEKYALVDGVPLRIAWQLAPVLNCELQERILFPSAKRFAHSAESTLLMENCRYGQWAARK